MAKILFRNLKGFYFGGSLFAPVRGVNMGQEQVQGPPPGAERGPEAPASAPPATAEQVAKAKEAANAQIAEFEKQIVEMQKQAGGNPNKKKAAEIALTEIGKAKENLNKPNLTPEEINRNLDRFRATLANIREYPAERSKLEKRMPGLLRQKDAAKKAATDNAKDMIAKVLNKPYFKKITPEARAAFEKELPKFQEAIRNKIDDASSDIKQETLTTYTLQYVTDNPDKSLSALNASLNTQEKNLESYPDFTNAVIEEYFHSGEAIAITDLAKSTASSTTFMTEVNGLLATAIKKASKDNHPGKEAEFTQRLEALSTKVNSVLSGLNKPEDSAKRSLVMAYFKSEGNVIYAEAKNTTDDHLLTHITFQRSGLSQADADALATALGIDQKILTGKEKVEPPKVAPTTEVTTPAAQPAEAPKGPPDAPQLQKLIKENAPQDLIEMFKLAQSQGLSEYYDALYEIAANGEKPSGTNFMLRFNKENRTYRFFKEGGEYKVNWMKGDQSGNLFRYKTRAQAMKEIINGEFMQSSNFYSGLVTNEFVNNPDKNKDITWYKKYEKQIGEVEITNFNKKDCSVNLGLSWKSGDVRVEAKVLPHGMISYRVSGNYVGFDGENWRVGDSANFDDFMKQLERIKNWSENFENLAGNSGWQRSPNYLRERQSSWINNPEIFIVNQQWIGKPLNFETRKDGHTEVYLDYTNTGDATPTGPNPMLNMRVLNNGMIQYDFTFKGKKDPPMEAPNIDVLLRQLTDIKNQYTGRPAVQPAAGVPGQPVAPASGAPAAPPVAPSQGVTVPPAGPVAGPMGASAAPAGGPSAAPQTPAELIASAAGDSKKAVDAANAANAALNAALTRAQTVKTAAGTAKTPQEKSRVKAEAQRIIDDAKAEWEKANAQVNLAQERLAAANKISAEAKTDAEKAAAEAKNNPTDNAKKTTADAKAKSAKDTQNAVNEWQTALKATQNAFKTADERSKTIAQMTSDSIKTTAMNAEPLTRP